jgi:hypothetical protein
LFREEKSIFGTLSVPSTDPDYGFIPWNDRMSREWEIIWKEVVATPTTMTKGFSWYSSVPPPDCWDST